MTYVLSIRLANSIAQRTSLEADSRSTGRNITCYLLGPKIYCSFHKSQPLDPILSQINQLCILTDYPFKIHFNIILTFIAILLTRRRKYTPSAIGTRVRHPQTGDVD
jgi:hypothetical protein